jgi:colanic acid/amylovoran biosynthesis glycosyltransferase
MERSPVSVGYLVPEFPGQTHAFFWREAFAMEELGTGIQFLSTRRPPVTACPHDFRDAAVARSRYLFPPDLAAAAGWLLRRPGGMIRALRYVSSLSETSVSSRLRLFGLVPVAAALASHCQRQRISHVHIHSCAVAAHVGALARLLGGPTYSLTLHGDLPVYGTDHKAKFARASFVSAVTCQLAEAIREVSPDTAAPVIWMGVDTDKFAPREKLERKAGGPLRIVSVARLNHTKGHRFFLEAMASVLADGHDIRYSIAGEGPDRAAIESEIARLGLRDRVELLGALGEVEVLELLGGADALALTSFGLGEAAPVAVMEAMACGLPVICSRIGGTPDMITDGKDGLLVEQKDPASIASALLRLVNDPEEARKMGAAARETAIMHFGFRANAAKLLAEISKVGSTVSHLHPAVIRHPGG